MNTKDSAENPVRPVLDWLLLEYPDTPKKRAKQWIQAGRVAVNGVVLRRPDQAIPDPRGALDLRDRQAATLDCGRAGWPIHPRVILLHLDTALAVLNKGPGLLSVPARPGELSALGILAGFLAGRLRPRIGGPQGRDRTLPPAYRGLEPLPVHRLDQYTSGVFCLAMNPGARRRLIEQVRTHAMTRQYVAYVEGRPARAKGTWRNRLELSDDERRQSVVGPATTSPSPAESGEIAVTHYEVMAEFPLAAGAGVVTKLRLRLETGLKHQIRIQAAHAGLPLVGDRIYGARHAGASRSVPRVPFDRQALHAEILGLEHPESPGSRLTWTAALPRDLLQLEEMLRQSALRENRRR